MQPYRLELEGVLPFPTATGRGVRAAVIDSGVNPKHAHIAGIAGGVSILGPDGIEAGDFADVLGHGTAVTAAIQEKAPDAEYYAVKLFHNSLRTTTPTLLAAVEWAIERGMDVINLSLGTLNFDAELSFRAVLKKASDRGIILVSAREAHGRACLPGSLAEAIGVGLDWECPRNRYRCGEVEGSPVYYASGYPRSLPGVPPERNLRGISFAVANMTGFVLRARELYPAADVRRALADEIITA